LILARTDMVNNPRLWEEYQPRSVRLYPGKWFNELTLWAYHGFQWLGWVDDPFTVFWRE